MVDVWLERILFYSLALVTVGAATVVTFGRNLVRSAFALFFTLMGMAAMFVYLAADFVALVHILVYIGGILVLILFGIWLTHRVIDLDIRAGRVQLVPGMILGLVLIGLLGLTIQSFDLATKTPAPYRTTVSGIGRLLLSTYLLPFEIASVALVLALVGAIVIGRRETSR
ncbi:MAG: NADH-quinone oxidoreductase subunit J [Acidobacteria bacterium]|nr:NADH-quinone oxidoreductase subunit J [Acidobacteriota bacterium]MDW7983199.1 NADH-quinone oxidoreductase subunit J [Acidobacteriota bacterium]